jgi:hypothetical protein
MDCILYTASLQRRTRKHSGLPTAGLDVPRRSIGNHRIAGRSSFVPPERPLYLMVRRFSSGPVCRGNCRPSDRVGTDGTPARCEVGMCEKCVALDAKIDRYQRMARMITDQRTLDGIAKAIEEANAEKAALHPEQEL